VASPRLLNNANFGAASSSRFGHGCFLLALVKEPRQYDRFTLIVNA